MSEFITPLDPSKTRASRRTATLLLSALIITTVSLLTSPVAAASDHDGVSDPPPPPASARLQAAPQGPTSAGAGATPLKEASLLTNALEPNTAATNDGAVKNDDGHGSPSVRSVAAQGVPIVSMTDSTSIRAGAKIFRLLSSAGRPDFAGASAACQSAPAIGGSAGRVAAPLSEGEADAITALLRAHRTDKVWLAGKVTASKTWFWDQTPKDMLFQNGVCSSAPFLFCTRGFPTGDHGVGTRLVGTIGGQWVPRNPSEDSKNAVMCEHALNNVTVGGKVFVVLDGTRTEPEGHTECRALAATLPKATRGSVSRFLKAGFTTADAAAGQTVGTDASISENNANGQRFWVNPETRLATFFNREEHHAVFRLVSGYAPGSGYFIGLNDKAEENKWRWADVTPANLAYVSDGASCKGVYCAWSASEPNDYNGEDCVVPNSGAPPVRTWNDLKCSTRHTTVCEIVEKEAAVLLYGPKVFRVNQHLGTATLAQVDAACHESYVQVEDTAYVTPTATFSRTKLPTPTLPPTKTQSPTATVASSATRSPTFVSRTDIATRSWTRTLSSSVPRASATVSRSQRTLTPSRSRSFNTTSMTPTPIVYGDGSSSGNGSSSSSSSSSEGHRSSSSGVATLAPTPVPETPNPTPVPAPATPAPNTPAPTLAPYNSGRQWRRVYGRRPFFAHSEEFREFAALPLVSATPFGMFPIGITATKAGDGKYRQWSSLNGQKVCYAEGNGNCRMQGTFAAWTSAQPQPSNGVENFALSEGGGPTNYRNGWKWHDYPNSVGNIVSTCEYILSNTSTDMAPLKQYRYFESAGKMSFTEASIFCEAQGMYMPALGTLTEWRAFQTLWKATATVPDATVWLGARRVTNDKTGRYEWQWADIDQAFADEKGDCAIEFCADRTSLDTRVPANAAKPVVSVTVRGDWIADSLSAKHTVICQTYAFGVTETATETGTDFVTISHTKVPTPTLTATATVVTASGNMTFTESESVIATPTQSATATAKTPSRSVARTESATVTASKTPAVSLSTSASVTSSVTSSPTQLQSRSLSLASTSTMTLSLTNTVSTSRSAVMTITVSARTTTKEPSETASLPVAVPAPPSYQQVKTVSQTGAVGGAVVAAFAGAGGGGALALQRLAVLAAVCEPFEPNQKLPRTASPLALPLGLGPAKYNAGAAFLACVYIVLAGMIVFLAALCHYQWRLYNREKRDLARPPFVDSIGKVYAGHVFLAVYILAGPAATEAATAAAMFSEGSMGGHVVGFFTIIFILSPLIILPPFALRHSAFSARFIPRDAVDAHAFPWRAPVMEDAEGNKECCGRLLSVLRWFFSDRGDWVGDVTATGVSRSELRQRAVDAHARGSRDLGLPFFALVKDHVELTGALYVGTRAPAMRLFPVIELFTSLVFGILGTVGSADYIPCIAIRSVLMSVSFLLFLSIVILRPHVTRMDVALGAISAALEGIAAAPRSSGSGIGGLLFVLAGVGTLQVLMGLILHIRRVWRRQRAKALAQRSERVKGLQRTFDPFADFGEDDLDSAFNLSTTSFHARNVDVHSGDEILSFSNPESRIGSGELAGDFEFDFDEVLHGDITPCAGESGQSRQRPDIAISVTKPKGSDETLDFSFTNLSFAERADRASRPVSSPTVKNSSFFSLLNASLTGTKEKHWRRTSNRGTPSVNGSGANFSFPTSDHTRTALDTDSSQRPSMAPSGSAQAIDGIDLAQFTAVDDNYDPDAPAALDATVSLDALDGGRLPPSHVGRRTAPPPADGEDCGSAASSTYSPLPAALVEKQGKVVVTKGLHDFFSGDESHESASGHDFSGSENGHATPRAVTLHQKRNRGRSTVQGAVIAEVDQDTLRAALAGNRRETRKEPSQKAIASNSLLKKLFGRTAPEAEHSPATDELAEPLQPQPQVGPQGESEVSMSSQQHSEGYASTRRPSFTFPVAAECVADNALVPPVRKVQGRNPLHDDDDDDVVESDPESDGTAAAEMPHGCHSGPSSAPLTARTAPPPSTMLPSSTPTNEAESTHSPSPPQNYSLLSGNYSLLSSNMNTNNGSTLALLQTPSDGSPTARPRLRGTPPPPLPLLDSPVLGHPSSQGRGSDHPPQSVPPIALRSRMDAPTTAATAPTPGAAMGEYVMVDTDALILEEFAAAHAPVPALVKNPSNKGCGSPAPSPPGQASMSPPRRKKNAHSAVDVDLETLLSDAEEQGVADTLALLVNPSTSAVPASGPAGDAPHRSPALAASVEPPLRDHVEFEIL